MIGTYENVKSVEKILLEQVAKLSDEKIHEPEQIARNTEVILQVFDGAKKWDEQPPNEQYFKELQRSQ